MNRSSVEAARQSRRRLDHGATAVALLLTGAAIVTAVNPSALVHHSPATPATDRTRDGLTRPSGQLVMTLERTQWSTPGIVTTRPHALTASTITTQLRVGLEPTLGATLESLAVPLEPIEVQSTIDATRLPRR